MNASHPSHSLPKCVDCRHFKASEPRDQYGGRCHHPVNGVDLVQGRPIEPACLFLRENPQKCGPQAHWFVSSTELASVCTAPLNS